MFDAQLSVTVN